MASSPSLPIFINGKYINNHPSFAFPIADLASNNEIFNSLGWEAVHRCNSIVPRLDQFAPSLTGMSCCLPKLIPTPRQIAAVEPAMKLLPPSLGSSDLSLEEKITIAELTVTPQPLSDDMIAQLERITSCYRLDCKDAKCKQPLSSLSLEVGNRIVSLPQVALILITLVILITPYMCLSLGCLAVAICGFGHFVPTTIVIISHGP
jgi:hypothetical protein